MQHLFSAPLSRFTAKVAGRHECYMSRGDVNALWKTKNGGMQTRCFRYRRGKVFYRAVYTEGFGFCNLADLLHAQTKAIHYIFNMETKTHMTNIYLFMILDKILT